MNAEVKELLELAAKAAVLLPLPAGKELGYTNSGLMICGSGETIKWEPLTDSGDALRLAVCLRLRVEVNDASVLVQWNVEEREGRQLYEYPDSAQDDLSYSVVHVNHEAATRRAIVRAAAAIGREMQ